MEELKQLDDFILDETNYKTNYTRKFALRKPYAPKDLNLINAFIPGVIFKIYVSEGQLVKKGDKLIVLEAMKMKNDLLAPKDSKVENILVKSGDKVTKEQLLIKLADI